MINNSSEFPYFRLTNNGPAGFAFSVEYTSGGVPGFGYSKVINPGNFVTIDLPWNAQNIIFKVYVYVRLYVLPTIYVANFSNAFINRCYQTSGTSDMPNILRIPCFNVGGTQNNCCCCCCCK